MKKEYKLFLEWSIASILTMFFLDILFAIAIERELIPFLWELFIHALISGVLVLSPIIIYYQYTKRDVTDIVSIKITKKDLTPLIFSFILYIFAFCVLGLIVHACGLYTEPYLYICYISMVFYLLDFWIIWYGILVLPDLLGTGLNTELDKEIIKSKKSF